MSQTTTYNFKTILPKQVILSGVIATIIVLIFIIVAYATGYWSNDLLIYSLVAISVPIIGSYIRAKRRKDFLSFTPDALEYNLQFDEGVTKYSELESIEVGDEYIKFRTMKFPRTIDLRYANSTEDADAIKNKFRELKREYIDS